MSKRKNILIANWKMNGSQDENHRFINGFYEKCPENIEICICPPYLYIAQIQELLSKILIKIGAQNVSKFDNGAYTGDVSASMLADFDCEYAIVGHSERRSIFKEINKDIVLKIKQLQKKNIVPVFCVGESNEDREAGIYRSIIENQIDSVFRCLEINSLFNIVVAYEPVWAIGTGKTATPDQAQEAHRIIRNKVSTFDKKASEIMSIIYGGSLNNLNSKEILSQKDIDGGLVGGASLSQESFKLICNEFNEICRCK